VIVDLEKIAAEVRAHAQEIARVGNGEVQITVTSRGSVTSRIIVYLPRVDRGPTHVGADPGPDDLSRA
jgi:hypothetical protein